MKILVVTPYFYPKIGGMELYAYHICRGLKEKYGWEVVVVTSNHETKKYKEEIISGLKIYRMPFWFKVSNTPINPLWFYQIKNILKKEKPEIINAHTPVPFISDIVARIHGTTPFILTYQNDLVKKDILPNLLCKLYYCVLGNKTLKISDRLIATSTYYTQNSPYLKNHLSKLKIVSPGVDLSKFNLEVKNNFLKNKYGDIPLGLFVGQLDKTHIHKGVNYLLEAVVLVKNDIPNVKIIFVGSGDNINAYKIYAQKLNIENNVTFVGHVPEEELPMYYAGSDVTILPSCNDSEGFGMVLIEAGACGRPVIGTKVGGIPFVIDNGKTGLLVPPKDPIALAKAITTILKNPSLANELGQNGHSKVTNTLSWNGQIEKTKEIAEEVINSK